MQKTICKSLEILQLTYIYVFPLSGCIVEYNKEGCFYPSWDLGKNKHCFMIYLLGRIHVYLQSIKKIHAWALLEHHLCMNDKGKPF